MDLHRIHVFGLFKLQALDEMFEDDSQMADWND